MTGSASMARKVAIQLDGSRFRIVHSRSTSLALTVMGTTA